MFDTRTLFIVIIGTVILFSWVFRIRGSIAKFYFGFMALMYMIYSGFGASLPGVDSSYVYYYFAFAVATCVGLYFGLKQYGKRSVRRDESWCDFFKYWIDKYGTKIIILYFCILMADLVYPENKIINLIKPPTPDAIASLAARYQNSDTNAYTSLMFHLRVLLHPFFLLSLYKYRKQTIKLSLVIIFSYYLVYCKAAYIGRGAMMEAGIIIGAFTYFNRPKLGKIILICALVAIPSLMVFFVQYSITRIGGTAGAMSSSDAFEVLITQECGYPQHFSKILSLHNSYWFNYLVWLFTMPLPGFFRFGVDANLNALFTESVTNMVRGDRGWSIALPGIVGESVFIWGKYLFWINGLLYGYIAGKVYQILRRYPQLLGLLITAAIDFGYTANRGGVVSTFPTYLKVFVYFYLIMWYLKQKRHWRRPARLAGTVSSSAKLDQ